MTTDALKCYRFEVSIFVMACCESDACERLEEVLDPENDESGIIDDFSVCSVKEVEQ